MSNAFSLKRPKYLVGNKPFCRLPLKQRAIFVLHMAGFTYEDMLKLKIVVSPETISRYLAKGYGEYGE